MGTEETPEKIRDYAERYILSAAKQSYGLVDIGEFFADEIQEGSAEQYDEVLTQIREAINRAEISVYFPYGAK